MKFSARSLVGAAVVAPFAAALAVAVVPASAAPGPSTALLYDTAAAAHPVTRTLPRTVVQSGGRTAEAATGTADGALRAAPGTSRLRSGEARCTGECLRARRASGTGGLPVPAAAANGAVKKLGDTIGGAGLGQLAGGRPALPAGRRAGAPVSMALPAAPADLPSVPSALAPARPGATPALGAVLFPSRRRQAVPAPSDDVLGRANGTVNKVGAGLDQAEGDVGHVVDVLTATDRSARSAGGPPAPGPLSMPDAAALGLPGLPAIG
ncbi:hypothetical protein [Actinomadura monticuli]|uniref:Uncharacterized protein n=1 Tax=Actinomadura monticuli TaxID=3097367 RepID=A0ABV4QEU7_9ACTN